MSQDAAAVAVLDAAQCAFDETAFYRDRYRDRPASPADVPFVSHAAYHRANGLLECICDREEIIGAIAPWVRGVRRFPYNIVESETESAHRFDRLLHALGVLDLRTGEPVDMVGTYDEMSPRSFPDYPGGTSQQRWLRELLRRTMEAEGFTVYSAEWWHFDHDDWREYAIQNDVFGEIRP